MAIIGIPTRTTELIEDDRKIEGVAKTYLDAVISSGGTPLIIPLLTDSNSLKKLYELCAAILLTGGEDVDPKRYGEAPSTKLGKVDPIRDQVECTLVEWAARDKKPLLGICRGIQVINVALGGTLIQDIPSEVNTTLDHSTGNYQSGKILSHALTLEKDSKLAELIGSDNITVNSLHHQAIKKLAPSLAVSARGDDKIIEAVEMKDHPFLIGAQCHPELLYSDIDPRWHGIFKALVNAAEDYARTSLA